MEHEMSSFFVRGALGPYEKPSLTNLATAQELFQQLLQSRSAACLDSVKKWSSLGFTLSTITDGGLEFAVVSECPGSRGRGNGFYVVKLSNKKLQSSACQGNVVLQAMHTPSDLHIHKVAHKLLMENRLFVAAAWNTAHRSKVDLGKETNSYFNSFTAAVARSFPKPRIIQLHAFDAKSHKINGDMILSSSRPADAKKEHYQRLVACLRRELKEFVILHFPRDINVLGGTLNINASVFYANNPDGEFYHVEMSLPLRLELRDKQEARSCFTRSFL